MNRHEAPGVWNTDKFCPKQLDSASVSSPVKQPGNINVHFLFPDLTPCIINPMKSQKYCQPFHSLNAYPFIIKFSYIGQREENRATVLKGQMYWHHLRADCVCVSGQMPASQRQVRSPWPHLRPRHHTAGTWASHKPRFKLPLCHLMTSALLPNLSSTPLPNSKVEALHLPPGDSWDWYSVKSKHTAQRLAYEVSYHCMPVHRREATSAQNRCCVSSEVTSQTSNSQEPMELEHTEARPGTCGPRALPCERLEGGPGRPPLPALLSSLPAAPHRLPAGPGEAAPWPFPKRAGTPWAEAAVHQPRERASVPPMLKESALTLRRPQARPADPNKKRGASRH